jgi:hypothetical protein
MKTWGAEVVRAISEGEFENKTKTGSAVFDRQPVDGARLGSEDDASVAAA